MLLQPDPSVYQASVGISPTPSLQAAGAARDTEVGAFKGSLQGTLISRNSGWWTECSSAANRPLSQCGGLSHGRGGLMRHILNPPFDGKGSSYHDLLLLCKRF